MTSLQSPPLAPQASADPFAADPEAGLHYTVAKNLAEVTEAWELLYRVYLRAGFVAPNRFELHTFPEAINEGSAVILTKIQGLTVGTITAIGDGPAGLPLDSVYHNELQTLRKHGSSLIEVGLFGDRRDDMDRSFVAVLELMRYTFWFGRHTNRSDFVCGIPPRRAKLYARAFGFDIIGNPTSYSSVEDNPVVLLRSNTEKAIANRAKHKAIAYFLDHPLAPDVFEHRFKFLPSELRGSTLEQYLEYKNVLQLAAPKPTFHIQPAVEDSSKKIAFPPQALMFG
jgi:hypothetical protein